MLQSGEIHMWSSEAILTEERCDHFLFTTPFMMEKYAALMKRQTTSFDVDIDGITAGIGVNVYAMLLSVFFLLFIVCWLNERWQYSCERNTKWQIICSLMPCHTSAFQYQIGVTRKILMATGGFGMLILSSLYQAKYSEVLMIPFPPPLVTIKDVERLVSSGNSKLIFFDENSPILHYITNVSEVFADSLHSTNPPMFVTDIEDELISLLNKHNGILFDTESVILDYLSTINPKLCSNYVYVTFDDWTRISSSLIMTKGRVDLLESMNVVVAERMSYMEDYVASFQLDPECKKHIFPVYTPDPSYDPLTLRDVSGTFALLVALLGVALSVLCVELISKNAKEDKVEEFELKLYDLHFHFDSTLSLDRRQMIMEKYSEMLDIIESDV